MNRAMNRAEIELPTAEQLKGELKRIKYRRDFRRIFVSTVSSLIVVAAAAVLISMLFLPVLRVTGTSMTPTLENNQLVVCHRNGDFKRGDVVAFYYNNKILLKRVIGVSGDYIDISEDGTVYVNGEAIDEPYTDDKSYEKCDIELPYQVPEQQIFVMGDHRSTSIDSRSSVIGCVSEEAVVGKVMFRIWPLKEAGLF
jgi:signal peptidase I